MEQSLKDYYKQRFDMFGSQGWKDLMEDVSKMKAVTGDISCCNDEKSFWKAKGELRLIDWLLNLEELSETAFNQLKDDDAAL